MAVEKLSHPRGLHLAQPGLRTEAPVGVTAINGLFGSPHGWQEQAMMWGKANTRASWSNFHYWEGLFGWGHAGHRAALAALLKAEAAKRLPANQHCIGHSNGCRL